MSVAAQTAEKKPLLSSLSSEAPTEDRSAARDDTGASSADQDAGRIEYGTKQWVLIGIPKVKVNAPAHACFVFPCQQSTAMADRAKTGCCGLAGKDPLQGVAAWEQVLENPLVQAKKLFKQPELHCELMFGIEQASVDTAGNLEPEEVDERDKLKKQYSHDNTNPVGLVDDKTKFKDGITFSEYSEMFRNLFVAFLQGPDCQFDLLATKSVDEDEVFLQVFLHNRTVIVAMNEEKNQGDNSNQNASSTSENMERRRTTTLSGVNEPTLADVVGADLKMLVSVKAEKDDAGGESWYEKASKILKDNEGTNAMEPRYDWTRGTGLLYPSHTICDLNLVIRHGRGVVFDEWTETDKIRMVYGKILEIFDIDEMVKQGLIETHFPQHDFEKVTRLMNFLPMTFNPGKLDFRLMPSHTNSTLLGLWQNGKPEDWDDEIRVYLGEEVGFYWNFIATYTRFLVIPAVLGVIMIFREALRDQHVDMWVITPRFMKDIGIIPEDNENFTDEWLHIVLEGEDLVRISQIINALFIAGWAAWFAQAFVQSEQEKIARWGMKVKGAGTVTTNDGYDRESARGFWDKWYETKHKTAAQNGGTSEGPPIGKYVTREKVIGFASQRLARFCGNTGVLLFFMLIVLSIGKVMRIRKDMVTHPADFRFISHLFHSIAGHIPVVGIGSANRTQMNEEVEWLGEEGGALLITFEIKVLDVFWDLLARWVVEKENHRTVQQKNESLAVKLFAVKVFNWSYPYLYIAFLKAHYEGCAENSSGEEDCIPELQRSLAIFFASSAAIDVAIMCAKWMLAFLRVRSELSVVREGTSYTYLQVQAKLGPPDLVLDELTVFMANFAFTAIFTIACPFIPVFAFLYNCAMCRLYMWKRLRLNQRNYPTSCAGIGVWTSLMKISVILSCVVNPMIAVFSMAPIKHFRKVNKGIFFMIIEHLLLVLVGAVFVLVNDTPEKATRFEEYNTAMLPRLLNPKQTRKWRIDLEATEKRNDVVAENAKTALEKRVKAMDIRPDCFVTKRVGQNKLQQA